jgi:hypothetical protein
VHRAGGNLHDGAEAWWHNILAANDQRVRIGPAGAPGDYGSISFQRQVMPSARGDRDDNGLY